MTAAAPTPSPKPRFSLPKRIRRWIDDPNPILIKELRSILRTTLFIRFLYLSTGLVGLIVIAFGGGMAAGAYTPAQAGQIVFQTFFTTALMIICLVAPAYAATSLTGERETGTYESLILTGMDPGRVVIGKFLASYSVFTLVIISFSPIVGIAFLFGGISPSHVILGFYGLLLVLGPAVALGVAISARLRSTRVSILLSLMIFAPTSLFATIFLAVLGEPAKRAWNLTMDGPFWFTEALSMRFFEADTFLLLGVMPLYLFGMIVWFFLASAVAGVRPAAEDRSTPFKWWGASAVVGLVAIMFGVMTLFDSNDIGEVGVAFNIAASMVVLFLALLFMNEPPLPPRLVELRREQQGTMRKALGVFGPGAAPTTRFAAVLVASAALGAAVAAAAARYVMFPSHHQHAQMDAGLVCVGVGTAVVCLFALNFGAYLRVVLRSGVASRVLTLAVLLAMIVVPLLASVIIDPDSLDNLDDDPPFMVRLSPIMHFILGADIADDGSAHRIIEMAVPIVVYGGLAFLFWVLLEARVRKVRGLVDAQRAAREARAEAAASSRPSFVPPELDKEAAAATAAAAAADLAAAIDAEAESASEASGSEAASEVAASEVVPASEVAPSEAAPAAPKAASVSEAETPADPEADPDPDSDAAPDPEPGSSSPASSPSSPEDE